MYMQVLGVLVVLLLLYYAAMIALDIQKAKAAKAAELENSSEVDIDISDEAETFKPVMISRDEPIKAVTDTSIDSENRNETAPNLDSLSENREEIAETFDVAVEEAPSDAYSEEIHSEETFANEIPQRSQQSDPESSIEEPFRRPGYREPVMTDGVPVEVLLDTVNRLAETGESDLGNLIYRCESSRIAS